VTTDGNHLGITVIGDGLIGLVAEQSLAHADSFQRILLGDGLMAAVASARMGIETSFVTRIGEDAFSDWLLRTWDSEHLHLDHVRRVAGPNGLLLLSQLEDCRERISYRSAAILDETDIAHLPWPMSVFGYTTGSLQATSSRTQDALVQAFTDARSQGVRTVYNPTLRPGLWSDGDSRQARLAFDQLVEHTDILITKAPYASGQLLGEPSAEEAALAAQRRGVSEVVVRDPLGGCVVADQVGTHTIVGNLAGLHPAMDGVFDGILMAGMTRGLSIEAASRHAISIMGPGESLGLGLNGIPKAWVPRR
jgi:sugar/nucleoside kinase (ribokinase family)